MSTHPRDPAVDVDPFDTDLDDDVPAAEPPHQSPVAGADEPLFGGLDVTAMTAELVGPAIRKAVGKKVDDLAARAVDSALTPDVLDRLRAEAAAAAESTLRGDGRTSAPGAEEIPELYYGSTDEFVREYLRHLYKRKVDGQHTFWSARWWESAEAVARLEALWRAWEHLRLDPSTGPSVWWRDHADSHMRVLMSSSGPFAKEVDTTSTIRDPLPYEQPPDGLFPDVRQQA